MPNILSPVRRVRDAYVIWSNKHTMWWGPNRCGYTMSLREAGVYSKADAEQIVADAMYTPEVVDNVAYPWNKARELAAFIPPTQPNTVGSLIDATPEDSHYE